ncbi:MAG: PTS sugar transporter subunit IIB [Actinomycetota bacterium]|nr:PTS sugar transporter subunit IIB [Actinomycetota bacterium]
MSYKLKKILVSCGTGVVASSFIAQEIRSILNETRLDAEIMECKAADIENLFQDVDIIVSTTQLPPKISRPQISGIPFITGNQISEAKQKLIDLLRD